MSTLAPLRCEADGCEDGFVRYHTEHASFSSPGDTSECDDPKCERDHADVRCEDCDGSGLVQCTSCHREAATEIHPENGPTGPECLGEIERSERMTEYKVGDEVYLATYSQRQVERPCPVCFGKRAVTVILGDDSEVQTPCDYCGKGYEGPRGWVTEYEREPRAERIAITSVRIQEGRDGRQVEYGAERYCLRTEDIFDDEHSALARAAELKRVADEEEAKRSDYGQRGTVRKISWSIGYHQREAKENRRSLAYHEARIVALKARMKPVTKGEAR